MSFWYIPEGRGNYISGRKRGKLFGSKDALENGIAMVHQELNQCLERNVVDNLFLGRYPVNSFGMIDEGRMKKKRLNYSESWE